MRKMRTTLCLIFLGLCGALIQKCVSLDQKDYPQLKYINEDIDPCEDFYEFSCGNFKNIHPLPENALHIDQYTLITEKINKQVKEILTLESDDDEPEAVIKAKLAYASCIKFYPESLSTHTYYSPEFEMTQEIGGLPIINNTLNYKLDWNTLGKWTAKYAVPLIFTCSVSTLIDTVQSNMLTLNSETGNVPFYFRPEEDDSLESVIEKIFRTYGKNETEKTPTTFKSHAFKQTTDDILEATFKKIIQSIIFYIQNIEGKPFEWPNVDKEFNDIRMFLKKYNTILDDADKAAQQNPLTAFNFTELEELQIETNKYFKSNKIIDWKKYLNSIFSKVGANITHETMIQYNLNTTVNILQLVMDTKPETIVNLMGLKIMMYSIFDSKKEISQQFLEYLQKSSSDYIPDRESYCMNKLTDPGNNDIPGFSFAISHAYQKYFFNHNLITQVSQMSQNILKTYYQSIKDKQWMSSESKENAAKKLENIALLIGFPEFIKDPTVLNERYDHLKVCQSDTYKNSQRLRQFKQFNQFSNFNTAPAERRDWWRYSPLMVNTFEIRTENKVEIPMGMINSLFFNGSNNILDYATLGSILAHELTHGFDNGGIYYDENGNYVKNTILDEKTKAKYFELQDCLIEQYNQYDIPELGVKVNGNNSLIENLADEGGIRQSYKAMKTFLKIENGTNYGEKYTAEQLFFIGYASKSCSVRSTNYIKYVHEKTAYPPDKYRVNGPVSNMQEFSNAFNCPVGSPMNREKKCEIW